MAQDRGAVYIISSERKTVSELESIGSNQIVNVVNQN